MKFLVLLTLMAAGARAQDGATDDGPEQPRVLCGRILADARMLYCYSNTEPQKRSTPAGLMAALYQRQLSQQTSQQQWLWQWLGRSHAVALRSKRDPGLVDECCLKACYVSELLSYC